MIIVLQIAMTQRSLYAYFPNMTFTCTDWVIVEPHFYLLGIGCALAGGLPLGPPPPSSLKEVPALPAPHLTYVKEGVLHPCRGLTRPNASYHPDTLYNTS